MLSAPALSGHVVDHFVHPRLYFEPQSESNNTSDSSDDDSNSNSDTSTSSSSYSSGSSSRSHERKFRMRGGHISKTLIGTVSLFECVWRGDSFRDNFKKTCPEHNECMSDIASLTTEILFAQFRGPCFRSWPSLSVSVCDSFALAPRVRYYRSVQKKRPSP